MNHVFGIRRRVDAGLLMRGSNGRAIRQHLGSNEHNHMRRGGHLFSPIQHTVEHAMSNMHISNGGKGIKTYVPLKFKM
jgi:hypothetical protein